MATREELQCKGCNIECKYGYFQEDKIGHYYPILNGKVIKYYWAFSGRNIHVHIKPNDLRTAQQAIAIADKIRLRCRDSQK